MNEEYEDEEGEYEADDRIKELLLAACPVPLESVFHGLGQLLKKVKPVNEAGVGESEPQ